MFKRTVPLLLLAALAFPATAAAQKLELKGPVLVKGHGILHGEVTMAAPSETRPITFGGRRGFVRFVDLSGDLRVKCEGRGKARKAENAEGQTVYTCMGRGGRAKAHGSHFAIRSMLRTYGLLIPNGVTATLQGRFKTCVPGSDECRAGAQGERPKRGREAADRAQERGERAKERAEKAKERAEKRKERGEKAEESPSDEDADEDDEDAEDEDVPSVEEVEEIVEETFGSDD